MSCITARSSLSTTATEDCVGCEEEGIGVGMSMWVGWAGPDRADLNLERLFTTRLGG